MYMRLIIVCVAAPIQFHYVGDDRQITMKNDDICELDILDILMIVKIKLIDDIFYQHEIGVDEDI